ncbi:MAG TPA: GTPase HflX [Clostridiales bacterium]|nr:GTPase HflX [Clostridiales bacterium]
MSLIEIKDDIERFILVGVTAFENDDTEQSLDELKELVYTAGGVVVGRLTQNREKVHPATYIGKGKIDELKNFAYDKGATGIICDDELSPAQLRNLKDELQIKVLDRTIVILDIFASRASTREGKIQVELAQLKYRSTRLIGLGNELSRLAGGIGTRGPGETKLEVDRRVIRERIGILNKELDDVKKGRQITRNLRSNSFIPVVAIVGYTNAGKSTLLNYLTDAKVLEEDKLFATLDPTTRNFTLDSGEQILLTDTVGFIRKLPHHLIEAFRSTLEEAKYANIIIHVVDSSSPNANLQMHIVYETLEKLGIKDKTIITVFNKQDKMEEESLIKDLKADYTVKISAKKGDNTQSLLKIIEDVLKNQKVYVEKVISYDDASKIQIIRKSGILLEEEYRQEGIFIKAYVPKGFEHSL